MKIKILHGKNWESNNEIDVFELMNTSDIKELVKTKFCYPIENCSIIYKNFIIDEKKFMKFYKIQTNDVIWIGNIEDYLKNDDIIVEIFLVGMLPEFMYLILDKNDQISQLILIIETVIPDNSKIKIWNLKGNLLKDGNIFKQTTTIDEYVKIIVCWGDEINFSFEECCRIHDRYLNDQYYWRFDWKIWFDEDDLMVLMTDEIREDIKNLGKIIVLNVSNDSHLEENWSYVSKSYQNSRYFFCMMFGDRILDLCEHHLALLVNKYDVEIEDFENFFLVPLHISIFDYLCSEQCFANEFVASIRNIVINAVNYYIDSLTGPNKNGEHLLRLFIDKFLLTSPNDLNAEENSDEYKEPYLNVDVKHQDVFYPMKIPTEVGTVVQAKQAIGWQTGVELNHLYLIESGGHQKPSDMDNIDLDKYMFDETSLKTKFLFEIVSSMDSIEVLKQLGKGAFGEVFLCQNKIFQKQFVLKKQLKNECDLYRDLSIQCHMSRSYNLIQYTGLFSDGEYISIAMNYISGGSLSAHLEKVKILSEEEIAKISYQILLSIKELHKQNIIHRDIKCDNIVLDKDHNAKLIDFGVSKCINQLPVETLIENLKMYTPGTLCYMAPEVINCQPYSNKIDIWSFGAMVIEMITGKRPYHKMGIIAASLRISKTKTIKFQPPFPISDDLKVFVNSCLNSIPEERPTAEELIKFKFIQNYGFDDPTFEDVKFSDPMCL